MSNYLTEEQFFSLNEKHGWFTYGDAQSDVSKMFAQDAIAMHERIRTAAPDLLAALLLARQDIIDLSVDCNVSSAKSLAIIDAAIDKATGETV